MVERGGGQSTKKPCTEGKLNETKLMHVKLTQEIFKRWSENNHTVNPLLNSPPPGQTYFKYIFGGLNRDGGVYMRWYQSTGRTRMQSGKHKYKKLEVMQPRITEYKSELLTREQIIPDPPNEVLQNNDKGEGRGDELKTIPVLLISFP